MKAQFAHGLSQRIELIVEPRAGHAFEHFVFYRAGPDLPEVAGAISSVTPRLK